VSMGGASPYRARFIGGQPGRDEEEVASDGSEKYFGLVNVKNTCYVNSVLQALYFCATFRRAAIRQLEEGDDVEGETLLSSLGELFAQIENQKKNVGFLTPRRFLTRLRKANDLFCNSEHQDAHEFLQFLLNDIVEQAKKRVKRQRERQRQEAITNGHTTALTNGSIPGLDSNGEAEEEVRTWVHDILQGYLVNQMKCLCCENVTVRRETFFDLSVDIEQQTSIAACLRAFESTERLRASNKFFCDTCGCLQEAEKRLRIYQLPSVLTLHLKRFKYVERLGRCCRLPYRVVFPLQLRVDEHRPPRRHGVAKQQQQPSFDGQTATGSPDSNPDGEEVDAKSSSRVFELRSVVVHIGRDLSYGHYVTIVRNGDRCVLLDDDVVRVVEPEILRSFYGSAGNNAGGGERYTGPSPSAPYYERAPEGTCCGYLLIYEAVDGASDADANAGVDLGSAADWISEDHNFSDSGSEGDSAEERPTGGQPRHPNACDDEVSQTFEQRCTPGTPAHHRNQLFAAEPAAAAPIHGGVTAAISASTSSSGPAGDQRGGTRKRSNQPSHHRPLGAVVPATGATDAVSLSRVHVATVPSPTGSLEGSLTNGQSDRGSADERTGVGGAVRDSG